MSRGTVKNIMPFSSRKIELCGDRDFTYDIIERLNTTASPSSFLLFEHVPGGESDFDAIPASIYTSSDVKGTVDVTTRSGNQFPASANVGEPFYHTTYNQLFLYDGTRWRSSEIPIVFTGLDRVTPITLGANALAAVARAHVPLPFNGLQGNDRAIIKYGSWVYGTNLSGSEQYILQYVRVPYNQTLITYTTQATDNNNWNRVDMGTKTILALDGEVSQILEFQVRTIAMTATRSIYVVPFATIQITS